MNKDIRKQYNNIAEDFSNEQADKNQVSRDAIYKIIGTNLENKRVLDLGCGDGVDTNYYHSIGADVVGIDASEELITIASKRYPLLDFKVTLGEKTDFKESSFDYVFSKYVIMTSENMTPIFDEVHRILKPGGVFVYVATHPFRQFLERRELSDNYFLQTKVKSHLFDNTVTVIEPTHTFNEYFSSNFLSKFEIVNFEEAFDPAAENIFGGKYPGFFIVKAFKK